MPAGFEIDDAILENLGPQEAVFLFRDLLWASFSEACNDRGDVHVPISIFERDEGIDAITRNADENQGLIPLGKTGYQVKSGDLSPADCKDEVLKSEGELKEMVEKAVSDNGKYVLVLFTDLTEAKRQRRLDKLKEGFQETGYPHVEVDLYTSSQLSGFINRVPSLVAKYSQGFEYAIDYSSWGEEKPIQSIDTYVPDQSREEYIEEIREILAQHEECPVVRINGISGLGKTRLAYELLAPDHLRKQVIYADAESFKGCPLENRLEIDKDLSAILVLDDCSPEDHRYFNDRFGARGERLTVITVSDSLKDVTADYQVELDPLDTEIIEEILENERPNLAKPDRERIAEFSEGFPQIAALLVENLDDGSESLLEMSTEGILENLIVGRQEERDFNKEEVKQVLEVFALFERVGWKDDEGGRHPDAEWLLDQFSFLDELGERKVERIVRRQRDKGILQGEYYLSLNPLPLATYLLQSYWRTYGHEFEEVFQEMPEKLLERFGERIPYMNAFPAGREWVSEILGPGGWFTEDHVFQSRIGSRLFLRFTEASAEDALEAANRFFQGKSTEDLLEFGGRGRRNMVWALQRMVVWEETFEQAALHLLALAEAENENHISNNATGIFTSLFTPAPGRVSRTEVPPMKRLPVLKQAIRADSADRQKIGASAAGAALKTDHFSKMAGPERQGARPLPDLWEPETWDELYDYYEEVWRLLLNDLDELEDPVRSDLVEVLLKSSSGIAKRSLELSALVRDTLERLHGYEWVDNGEVIKTAVRIVHYDEDVYPEEEAEKWRRLAEDLSESTYHNRLKRYVKTSLLADQAVGDEDGEDIYKVKMEELAEESVSHLDRFEEEVSWLISGQPSRSREFGVKLAEVDNDRVILDLMLDELREQGTEVTPHLLAGYLAKLDSLDADLRQEILDEIRFDDDIIELLPYLSLSSGLSDHELRRIFDAVDEGDLPDTALVELEPITRPSERISEPIFKELAERLLSEESGVGAVALLSIFYGYYVWDDDSPSIDEELAVEVLTHDVFLKNESSVQYEQGTTHEWQEVATDLLESESDAVLEILDPIFENLGNKHTLLRTSFDVGGVLCAILAEYPEETWERITATLEARDERMLWLYNWLSGGFSLQVGAAIKSVPPEFIWKWVDENREENAILAARLIPAKFFHDEEEVCLARQLLIRYGDIEEVRRAVSNNYHSESFVGSASSHYQKKKQEIEKFRENEDDPNVLKWTSEELADLDQRIRKAEMTEEGSRLP